MKFPTLCLGNLFCKSGDFKLAKRKEMGAKAGQRFMGLRPEAVMIKGAKPHAWAMQSLYLIPEPPVRWFLAAEMLAQACKKSSVATLWMCVRACLWVGGFGLVSRNFHELAAILSCTLPILQALQRRKVYARTAHTHV